jgi:hypothetical protein
MPPIQLSRSERASLQRIVERSCQPGDIPADHEEKFLNYGLVRKHVLLLCATPLGQCELLRQRFRGMTFPGAEVTGMTLTPIGLLAPVQEP